MDLAVLYHLLKVSFGLISANINHLDRLMNQFCAQQAYSQVITITGSQMDDPGFQLGRQSLSLT